MSKYTEPFYVNYEMARRMGYDKPFYLPPLELPEEPILEEVKIIHKHINIDRKALELQERIVALETKSHIHTDKKKDTKDYY